MKLVKLTDARTQQPQYVSADCIVGIAIQNGETIVYTSLRSWFMRVEESPEVIEALCNSEANTEPSYNQLIRFAQWFSQKGSLTIGQSYANIVGDYIDELRTPRA